MDKIKLDLGFEVDIEDLSFIHKMVDGGIYDDMSARSGDISFDSSDNISFQDENTIEKNFNETVLDVNYETLLEQIKYL